MPPEPAFAASLEDDALLRRGPALWEGRASLSGMLALRIPGLIALGLFFAGILAGALTPRLEGTSARLRVGGQWTDVDPATATAIGSGIYVVFLFFFVILLVAILAPVLRYRRQRYRIDGQAVEIAADGVIDRFAFADISRVDTDGYGAWHMLRIVAPGQRPGMLLGTREAMRALTLLRARGVACDRLEVLGRPAELDTLAPGESVRWRGRPGLGSFDAARVIAVIGLLTPLLILVLGLWWIWSAHPFAVAGFFFSGFLFCLVGYVALYLLAFFSEQLRAWFTDAFGTVLVTDRRIAWQAPLGRIYRDVGFAELIEAGIVEAKRRRAWVTLTIRDGDDVRSEDLHNLPDADRFLAVLRPAAR